MNDRRMVLLRRKWCFGLAAEHRACAVNYVIHLYRVLSGPSLETLAVIKDRAYPDRSNDRGQKGVAASQVTGYSECQEGDYARQDPGKPCPVHEHSAWSRGTKANETSAFGRFNEREEGAIGSLAGVAFRLVPAENTKGAP